MPSLFVSRELSAHSPLRNLGPAWQLSAWSLVELRARAFAIPPPHQWVFFYSAHAFAFYLAGLPQPVATHLAQRQLAALGPGTAAAMTQAGWPPHFVGSGEPAATAAAFGKLAAGQRVLFPQASASRQSVERALEGVVVALPVVVYHNQPNPLAAVQAPPCDYLVFTSPLNVQAYYTQHAPNPAQRVVAIGTSTAAALAAVGVDKVRISPQPTEVDLAQTLLDWAEE